MPSLVSNGRVLEYTTTTNTTSFVLTLTKLSTSGNFNNNKDRNIVIKVNNKNVLSVTAQATPSAKYYLSTISHHGKPTAAQKREAKVAYKARFTNNRNVAWSDFRRDFDSKKNNNQLIFTYTRGALEKELPIVFTVFGVTSQVVLKIPKDPNTTPTPSTHEETKTIGIESVNDGKNYVVNEAALAKYGWIERVVDFSDVQDEKQLLSLANIYVNNLQFDDVSIEISAVDLHHLMGSVPSFELLDEVRCISRPHGLNRTFPITEMTIPLDDPTGATYTMGKSGSTTMSQSNASNAMDLFKRLNNQPSAGRILDRAKLEMSNILNQRTTGYVNVVQENDISQALIISNTPDWTNATKLWKFDMNGLGYSDSTIDESGRYDNATTVNSDGRLYKIGMTMDGTIVADFIKTGLLEDGLGYNYWNLSTGEFRLSPNTLIDDLESESVTTIADLSDRTAEVESITESTAAKEFNSTNILKNSDDLSILNKSNKYWEDGGWQTSASYSNTNTCRVVITNAYNNYVNADIPASGISKAVNFIHTSSYSGSASNIQTSIYQSQIDVAVNTVYTMACYACGQSVLDLIAEGRETRSTRINLTSSGWKRYNLVFKIEADNFDVTAQRTRLNNLKATKTQFLKQYEQEYKRCLSTGRPHREIEAARKNLVDCRKEIADINKQLDSISISIRRNTSKQITVKFRHVGLGNACVAGMTLVKGNVSKDWQPSTEDIIGMVSRVNDKIDQEYIMNKLTDGGKIQGVFLKDKKLYINGEYIMGRYITDPSHMNRWDLERGILETTNMIATNIQASGQFSNWINYSTTNRSGLVFNKGKLIFANQDYKNGKWSMIQSDSSIGLERGIVINTLEFKTGSTLTFNNKGGIWVYPTQHFPSSSGVVTVKQAKNPVPGMSVILRIKAVTHNKKKKLVYATIAELTFTHGLLTMAHLYDKSMSKLRKGAGLSTGWPVKNDSYTLYDYPMKKRKK